MYIATHFGWVVLSCAVLMFFRKRSIQKTKQKKQSKWNSSISRSAGGTEPPRPGPAGDASSVGKGKGWVRAGGLWSRGSPLLGDHSIASQALLSVHPGVKSRGVFLRPPAAAQLLHTGAGAGEGLGSPCTEPVSTAPLARKRCNKWSLWCLKPISGFGGFFVLVWGFFLFFPPLNWDVYFLSSTKKFLQFLCSMCRGVQGAEALGQTSAAAHACQPIAGVGTSRGYLLPAPGHVLPALGASPDLGQGEGKVFSSRSTGLLGLESLMQGLW